MDKVIEEELAGKITITPEDISEYYQKHYQGRETESDSGQSAEDINEAIVKQLRMRLLTAVLFLDAFHAHVQREKMEL